MGVFEGVFKGSLKGVKEGADFTSSSITTFKIFNFFS